MIFLVLFRVIFCSNNFDGFVMIWRQFLRISWWCCLCIFLFILIFCLLIFIVIFKIGMICLIFQAIVSKCWCWLFIFILQSMLICVKVVGWVMEFLSIWFVGWLVGLGGKGFEIGQGCLFVQVWMGYLMGFGFLILMGWFIFIVFRWLVSLCMSRQGYGYLFQVYLWLVWMGRRWLLIFMLLVMKWQ